MIRNAFLFCFLLFAPLAQTLAETVYVTDRLKLTLRELPDGSGEKIKTLESGDKLTVLEQTKFYSKVKTADSKVGWAKSAYLVTEIPPRLRLTQLEAENNSLATKLESTQSKLAKIQQELQLATQDVQTMAQLKSQNAELLEEQRHYKYSVPMVWFLSVTITVLVLGFLAGLWWLDYRSRKRHGGYRIY